MDTAEYYSSDFCVMPSEVTAQNLFHGTQYYQTTMHLLGITECKNDRWVGRNIQAYDNSIFKGLIAYEHSQIYGSILVYAKVKRTEYFSCNGLYDPKHSTQILDLYKEVKAFCKKEYFGQYDVERYMFEKIYGSKSV